MNRIICQPDEEMFTVSDYFPPETVLRDGRFAHLDEADSQFPGSLVYCQNLRYLDVANNNLNISAIIASPSLAHEVNRDSTAVIVAGDPRLAFFTLYANFYADRFPVNEAAFSVGRDCRIHPTAVVSPRSRIGNRVEIGPHTVIDDFVDIGDDVSVGPNVVLGAEGLVTLRRDDGSLLLIKHAGGVEVGAGTQILAGAIVAKSLFRSWTHIGRCCQVGIMANIGHGAFIGDESVISGNTVIAGRAKLGRRVWVGASASIAQGLSIGAEAQIKMGSVVVADVGPQQVVSGNFATSHKSNMRHYFNVRSYEKI